MRGFQAPPFPARWRSTNEERRQSSARRKDASGSISGNAAWSLSRDPSRRRRRRRPFDLCPSGSPRSGKSGWPSAASAVSGSTGPIISPSLTRDGTIYGRDTRRGAPSGAPSSTIGSPRRRERRAHPGRPGHVDALGLQVPRWIARGSVPSRIRRRRLHVRAGGRRRPCSDSRRRITASRNPAADPEDLPAGTTSASLLL